MVIYYFSFLTFLLSISLTKQGLYTLSKNIIGNFTELDVKPYLQSKSVLRLVTLTNIAMHSVSYPE